MEFTQVFTAIILLSITGLIEAQQGAICHNEIITPSHNFNLSQFMGPWYGHAFAPGLAENLTPSLSYKCYRVEFVLMNFEDITLTQWYIDISNGSSTPVLETSSIRVTNAALPAYWRWFPNDSNDVSDTVYLHTDHRNWAVGYGCRIVDGYRYETFAVWTRAKFVDPIMTSVFKTLGEGYGFQSENLQFVEQGNCL